MGAPLLVVLSCIVASLAMPYPMPYPFPDEPGYGQPAYSPPSYGSVGRLKIQAYRGPSEGGKGYDSFAPWGFYVTQPKDNFYGYAHAGHGTVLARERCLPLA